MAQKKYASLSTLSTFLDKLKTLFATKSDVDAKLSGKSDTSHNHDGKYDSKGAAAAVQANLSALSDSMGAHTSNTDIHFTATERTKLSGIAAGAQVNTVTGVKGGSESSYRTGNINITKANIGLGNVDNTADANKSVNYATSAGSATSATKATQDGNGKVISSTYETKTDASSKLAEAKLYADTAANTVKNDLLNGAGSAYDTLKELGDLIDDNKDAIDVLEDVAAGKADAVHEHAISDIDGLTTSLANKADKYHGTHVVYLVADPLMDGEGSAGSKNEVARADHRHPTDTSRASKTEFDSHDLDTTKHITSAERTNWNTAKTHADSAHAPSNAEKNQNAFSNVKVGSTTIAADTTTDTLELVGSGLTITPDATNDKVTISVSNASLGQGVGYCSTDAATVAKVVSLSNYELVEGGVVTVEFVYSVPASATMNINSKGAQSIYYKGKSIENNVIKGGDRATFIYYSLRYHLISIDRWHKDIVDLQTNDRKVEQKVVVANANYPLLLAQYSQTADATGFTYFDSGVYLNPSTNTIKANIDGTATGLKNLTATIGELNYVGGVTSNVQTQLNNKSQVQIITWEAND